MIIKNVKFALIFLLIPILVQPAFAAADKNRSYCSSLKVFGLPRSSCVKGFEFALFNAYTDDVHGVQLSPIATTATLEKGMQIAVFSNFARSGAGVQIGALNNVFVSPLNPFPGEPLDVLRGGYQGVQLGLVNCAKAFSGFRTGAGNFSDEFAGLEIGIGNFSEAAHGTPVGVLNITRGHDSVSSGIEFGVANVNPGTFNGVQLGIVNASNHLRGVQIGIINVILHARIPFLPIINASW